MDWKKTFNRGQWFIHGIFAVAVLLGLGSTLFALRLNELQSTEEERGLKISSLIQKLKNDQGFEKLGKYLSWAESDKANEKMRELSAQVAQAEEILEIKASTELGLSMRNFNKLISSNSGMSNPADALKVLNQKVDQLKSIAQSQNYKNVGIIADRMRNRLSELNPKNAGSSVQVGYLKTDLRRIEQLVNASSLSESEKGPLTSRVQSMLGEVDLLANLNSHSRDLKEHVKNASLALGQWLIDAEKKASDLKGSRLEKQNQMILLLAGMLGFLITSWMGLAYLFRWQKVKMGEQVEMEVKGVIEKGVLGDQRFMVDHYSDLTREDIIKLLDGLKLKLNLGSMLHDGLPFAGCMVDNSFRLTWFNHLFLEQFYLSEEEVRSDSFNWDYLRDYLNLDEDPVYQAMVNKIAGIYPVKVKQDEYTPMQPYEMYVTPITINREDRVMIFFYPLVAVKEAIVEQVNMAKDSLGRFVHLWNEDKLSEDEMRILEKDFKNNDLDSLYSSLIELHERVEAEKDECLRTIRSLEKESSAYYSAISGLKKIEEERKDIIRKEFNLAGELKASFINSLERSESLLLINRGVLQQNDELKSETQKLQQLSLENYKRNRETLDILGQLDGVKIDYKKLKLELLEVKAKLVTLNSSLFGQLPPLDDHQQKLAHRYKDELARLDFNATTLDKKLSQLDVLLGKLQMMYEKASAPEQTHFNLQASQKDQETKDALMEIQKALGMEEGKIIEHFKTLHQLIKHDLGKTHESSVVSSVGTPTADAYLS